MWEPQVFGSSLFPKNKKIDEISQEDKDKYLDLI